MVEALSVRHRRKERELLRQVALSAFAYQKARFEHLSLRAALADGDERQLLFHEAELVADRMRATAQRASKLAPPLHEQEST